MLTLDHEIGHAQEDLLLQLRLRGCGSVRGRARAEHDLQDLGDMACAEVVFRGLHRVGTNTAWGSVLRQVGYSSDSTSTFWPYLSDW